MFARARSGGSSSNVVQTRNGPWFKTGIRLAATRKSCKTSRPGLRSNCDVFAAKPIASAIRAHLAKKKHALLVLARSNTSRRFGKRVPNDARERIGVSLGIVAPSRPKDCAGEPRSSVKNVKAQRRNAGSLDVSNRFPTTWKKKLTPDGNEGWYTLKLPDDTWKVSGGDRACAQEGAHFSSTTKP